MEGRLDRRSKAGGKGGVVRVMCCHGNRSPSLGTQPQESLPVHCWGKDRQFPRKRELKSFAQGRVTGISLTLYLTTINKTEGVTCWNLAWWLLSQHSLHSVVCVFLPHFLTVILGSAFLRACLHQQHPITFTRWRAEERKDRNTTWSTPLKPQPHACPFNYDRSELHRTRKCDILAGHIGSTIIIGCDCKAKSRSSI